MRIAVLVEGKTETSFKSDLIAFLLTGSNHKAPGTSPEKVNHGNPPAHRLSKEFNTDPITKNA